MKIRIKGNSIRFRLTKTNVADFGRQGFLEESTEFPGGPIFRYRLERKSGIDNLEASYTGNCINILVPEMITGQWTGSDEVGVEHTLDMGNGKKLFLLIEKDFVCLDHTLEDQSDNYANPNKVC